MGLVRKCQAEQAGGPFCTIAFAKILKGNFMHKFEIDIWFKQKPEKQLLGTVIVEAKTEAEAYKKAQKKTELWMVGKVGENETKLRNFGRSLKTRLA